jgi:hypothetical protein
MRSIPPRGMRAHVILAARRELPAPPRGSCTAPHSTLACFAWVSRWCSCRAAPGLRSSSCRSSGSRRKSLSACKEERVAETQATQCSRYSSPLRLLRLRGSFPLMEPRTNSGDIGLDARLAAQPAPSPAHSAQSRQSARPRRDRRWRRPASPPSAIESALSRPCAAPLHHALEQPSREAPVPRGAVSRGDGSPGHLHCNGS